MPVSVDWATANGTAVAGSDYEAASGTLTFAPGETSKTVTVQLLGDVDLEPNETFYLNLSNAVSGTITDAQAVGTITNDDTPPVVSANTVSVLEGNSGTATGSITIALSTPTGRPVTVDWATGGGVRALPGVDYVAASGTVNFEAGETSKTITV